MQATRMFRPLARIARRLGWGHNPLRRHSDRVETVTVLVAVVLACAAVPLALLTASTVYQQNLRIAAEQTAQRYQVNAVLLEATTSVPTWGGVADSVPANASWTGRDGSQHTGIIAATQAAPAGARVSVWTDAHGALVDPPLTPEQAWGRGALDGVVVMAVVIGLLATAVALTHWRLNRIRYTAWETEWQQIDPWRTHHAN